MIDWPYWIGSPLQLLSSVSLLGILTLMSRTYLANRKLDIETKVLHATTDTEARKILLSEVLSLRAALKDQSDRHRLDLSSAEERYSARARSAEARHEECIASRESTRSRMSELQDEMHEKTGALRDLVAGLRRIITQASALHAIEISENLSDDVRAAAERVDRLFREGRHNGNSS